MRKSAASSRSDSPPTESPKSTHIKAPQGEPTPGAPRSRFTPKAVGGLVLGERDAQMLTDLYLHRAMSRQQVQELHFASVPRCNARLRQLFDFHFVRRHYSPLAPFGAQAIYSAGKAAAPIIAQHLNEAPQYAGLAAVELSDVREGCQSHETPAFLEHTLAIVQFWLDMRKAVAAHPALSLERWLPEMLCRHEYDVRSATGPGHWQREVFKPDGYLRLASKAYPDSPPSYHSCFLEIDLGHTSARQFLGKLHTHRRYLESGLFTEVYGETAFRTLVVTTGNKRLENLKALAEKEGYCLFWLTTFTDLNVQGGLAPIWRVPFAGEWQPLVEMQAV